jgi:PqqD family protein of HPr-rel-A system
VSTPDLDVSWGLAPGQALLHREWDGEYLLYNSLSGDTHLLDARAMRMLQALQAGVLPQPALAALLGCPPGPAGQEELDAMLASLEALSLIEASPC